MSRNYPHIDNYYKNIGDLLGKSVDVLEKIDGSNFSICCGYNGEISYCSKNQVIANEQGVEFSEESQNKNYGQFRDAVLIAKKFSRKISDVAMETKAEITLFFEFYGKGIQGRVNYDEYIKATNPEYVLNGKSLILIDAKVVHGNAPTELWFPLLDLTHYQRLLCNGLANLKYATIPDLRLSHIEQIRSALGEWEWLKEKEGVVIRESSRKLNIYNELVQCKVKTDWYEEYEKRGGVQNVKAKEIIAPEILDFAHANINFGRLNSVYSHGHPELKKEMRDMVILPCIIVKDIQEEKHPIWQNFKEEQIVGPMKKLLPIVLKKWLAEQSGQ